MAMIFFQKYIKYRHKTKIAKVNSQTSNVIKVSAYRIHKYLAKHIFFGFHNRLF